MKLASYVLPMKWHAAGRVAGAGMGLILCTMTLGGCAGNDVEPDRTAMLPEDQRVSSVPWNKPQGWENQTQLGALANDPRIGGGNQSR